MAGRRGHGEGSIYQRQDGRWVAVLDLGLKEGKRRRKSLYASTRREAQEALSKAHHQQFAGSLATGPRLTVERYVQQWLEESVRHRVKPRTFSSYNQLVRLHVAPGLGKLQLAKLQAKDLQHFYSKKLETLSPRTVEYLHAIIHRALKEAERLDLVSRNVADLVSPPRPTRKSVRFLAPREVEAFLAAVSADRLGPLFTVALFTGLRQGELLGLRWPDVDLSTQSLTVGQTLQLIDGKLVFGQPKSGTSRRTVPLTPQACEALRAWRTTQVQSQLQAGPAWHESGLVFTSEIGTPLFARNVTRRLHKLVQAAGLVDIKFHELRHSTASLLIAAGEQLKVVQEILGHSQISVTADYYSHLAPGLKESAMSRLDALVRSQAR